MTRRKRDEMVAPLEGFTFDRSVRDAEAKPGKGEEGESHGKHDFPDRATWHFTRARRVENR